MRTAAVVVLLVSACSQRSTPEEVETGAFRPEDAVHETDGAIRVDVQRRLVPLEDMPIVASVMAGLPMTGLADISIDLTVPKSAGAAHYREASGAIAFRCPTGCALGDNQTQFAPRGQPGIDFGHLALDSLDVRAEVREGHVTLTRWELVSKDLSLSATLRVDLADNLADSTLDGCVWWKPQPALLAREPKTHAVVMTTGASIDAEGYFQIKIGGRLGQRKLLAQQCRPT